MRYQQAVSREVTSKTNGTRPAAVVPMDEMYSFIGGMYIGLTVAFRAELMIQCP